MIEGAHQVCRTPLMKEFGHVTHADTETDIHTVLLDIHSRKNMTSQEAQVNKWLRKKL